MNLFKKLFGNNKMNEGMNMEVYSESQIDLVENHIINSFGKFEKVFHEMISPDIHVDIAIIPPNEKRKYYTLVTMGMGAHKMNVPENLKQYRLERAEMVVCLPEDWNIESEKEEFYWPLRWLKIMARLPINENSWLGYGHTVPNGGPFAGNTNLSGIMLLDASGIKEGARTLELSEGECVNFYQLFPIYEEEMNYKINNGSDKLLDLFEKEDITPVINIDRKNYCI